MAKYKDLLQAYQAGYRYGVYDAGDRVVQYNKSKRGAEQKALNTPFVVVELAEVAMKQLSLLDAAEAEPSENPATPPAPPAEPAVKAKGK